MDPKIAPKTIPVVASITLPSFHSIIDVDELRDTLWE